MASPSRIDLIVPIEWEGQLVTGLTIEGLPEPLIAKIQKLVSGRGSSRKALRQAVALATDCPITLIAKLCDRDLERAADMATATILSKAGELLR